MYDLSGILDGTAVGTVRPGSSILVSGPAMAGGDDIAMETLSRGLERDQGALVVSTNSNATETIEELAERTPELDRHRVAAIDCRADGGREAETLDSGATVQHVASPANLTEIGIAITKSIERLQDVGATESRLALTSLSTLITYTDRETVFKFCHVLSSRLDSAGFLGVFTIDASAHDEQTMQVIKQTFDGIVELRERDGRREARVGGLQPQPSDWVAL